MGAADDLWVFGYGSLMWRPGFDYLERHEGRLIGAHRALCVYSFVHRGTPQKPGLVLGLDHGGACRGIVYRVGAKKREATIEYLRNREQVTMVYRESYRTAGSTATQNSKCGRWFTRSTAAIRSMPAACRWPSNCTSFARVTAVQGRTAITLSRRSNRSRA